MKLILFLSLVYIATEFFDYIRAIIVHMVKGDYKSHTAKVGALKKLGVTAIVVFLPTICKIITEITSINETLQLIKGDNTDGKKA